MDFTTLLPILLEKGWTYTLLVLLGYWLFQRYIPSQQEFYQKTLQEQQLAHKEEVLKMLNAFEVSMQNLTEQMWQRLERIESKIESRNNN